MTPSNIFLVGSSDNKIVLLCGLCVSSEAGVKVYIKIILLKDYIAELGPVALNALVPRLPNGTLCVLSLP